MVVLVWAVRLDLDMLLKEGSDFANRDASYQVVIRGVESLLTPGATPE